MYDPVTEQRRAYLMDPGPLKLLLYITIATFS
jgi:hypothetical protein